MKKERGAPRRREQFLLEAFVTNRCNLSCSYCASRYMAQDKGLRRLSFEQLKRAADLLAADPYVRRNYPAGVKLSFTGGEPMLEYELIKRVVGYVRRAYPGWETDISTNGTLLTPERLEFFARNNVGISISLDGYKNVNDRHRRFCGPAGRSVFQVVEGNIRNGLADGRYRGLFHVAATLTSQTIEQLPGVVKYFREEAGFKELEIALEAYEIWDEAARRRLRGVFRGLKERFLRTLHREDGLRDIETSFNEFIFNQSKGTDCRELTKKAVTLFYDGAFYPCDFVVKPPLDPVYKIGDLESGLDFARLKAISGEPMFAEITAKCEYKSGVLSPVERYYWGMVHGYSPAKLEEVLANTSAVNRLFHEEMGAYVRLQKVYSRLFLTPGFGDFAHEPKYRASKEVRELRLAVGAGSSLVKLRAAADFALYSPGRNKRLLLDAGGGGSAALDLAEGLALYSLVKAAHLKKRLALSVAADEAALEPARRAHLAEHGVAVLPAAGAARP